MSTALSAWRVLAMATIDGARAIGRDNLVGSIEKGKRADIVVLDAARTNMTPLHEPSATIVHQATGAETDAAIIDGRILLERGVLTMLNAEEEAELRAEARHRSVEILRRSGLG